MKNKKMILFVCLLYSLNILAKREHHEFSNPPDQNGERSIVIVTASYNNKDWYKRNLDSIFCQNYKNYRLIYIDDCSPDGTGQLVADYIKEQRQAHRVTLIRNQKRVGSPLGNQYGAIHSCNDKDIIIIVDGDDFLAHPNVLQYINRVYSNNRIWLTYGQFIEYPTGVRGFCGPMPHDIVRRNAFREHGDIPSHLRTFYAGLFKQIEKEDMMYEGEFFKMTGDMGAMLPMIEMARDGHFKFIPDILYTYNVATTLNEFKISKDLQRKIDLIIRSRRRYEKVMSPVRHV